MDLPADKAVSEETRRRRRLQLLMDLTLATIAQSNMDEREAWDLIHSARAAAMHMFPDKELLFEMIYMSRFRRVMRDKYATPVEML